MSLNKSASQAMTYEATPFTKKPSQVSMKKAKGAILHQFSLWYLQGYIIWHLKHQIAYTIAGCAVLNWVFPPFFPMVLSAIQSLRFF